MSLQNMVLQNLVTASSPTLAYFEKLSIGFQVRNCLKWVRAHSILLRNCDTKAPPAKDTFTKTTRMTQIQTLDKYAGLSLQ